MDERRYLIVGGAGYFGARLAEALARTAKVTITQRSESPARREWTLRAGVEAVVFDSGRSLDIPVDGNFDAIVNLAMPGASEAASEPVAGRERSLATAGACLKILEQGRAARMVHFSTFHVYGGGGRIRYEETDIPAPVHPYGAIHLAVEELVLETEGVVVVRPSNLVGAPAHSDLGDQGGLFFLDLCRQAVAGRLRLKNDGLSYRDFLPFDDAIAAVRLLLDTKLVGIRLVNLACGSAMRLDSVARLISDTAGDCPPIEYGAGRDAFRAPFEVSVERLRALGWAPRASLANEAGRIIDFFRASS